MATTAQKKAFIDKIAPLAQKAYRQFGKPLPSICIAMAATESGWGLAGSCKYNSYMGQKVGTGKTATKYWSGNYFNARTQEVVNQSTGQLVTIKDNFRSYDSVEQCIFNYYELLNTSLYSKVLAGSSYKEQMQQIKACGYMTSVTETFVCISIIDQNGLTKYDGTASGTVPSAGVTLILNCGSDENGKFSGGNAGDQTGKEWCVRNWYFGSWKCVLRHPDPAVRALLASLGEKAALNDMIGYDQNQRDTYWKELQKAGYDPSAITTPCEADCSSGVISNVKAAGYLLGNTMLQKCTATYTGNMRAGLKAAGFEVLTDSKYITSSAYLLAGDVLLADGKHTATNLTDGIKSSGESVKSSGITVPAYVVGKTYTTQVELKVRTGPGTNYPAKSHNQLTADGQKHDVDKDGAIDAGTKVTCKQVAYDGVDMWINTPSGWLAAYYKGKIYIK